MKTTFAIKDNWMTDIVQVYLMVIVLGFVWLLVQPEDLSEILYYCLVESLEKNKISKDESELNLSH